MSYPPRIEVAGAYYHVSCKAVDEIAAFRDDFDRYWFLQLFAKVAQRCGWSILEYTVMSTHYHVLVRLREPALSSGFQFLNGSYARWFNKRYARRGAVWSSRFDSRLLDSEEHLREALRYDARNAVRAGICERPEDWQWCSYGATIDGDPPDPLIDEEELLTLFGAPVPGARQRFREFVDEPDRRRRRSQTLLGAVSETVGLP
jgi:REP element-mobilizing transposase RayT